MRKNIAIVVSLVIGLGGGFGLGGIFITVSQLMPSNEKYNDLQQDYNDLLNDYNELFGDYQSILDILTIAGNPLTDPDTPTIQEVLNWLAIDNTDTFEYTENFMCGDFSAMLMGKAKLMNWRVRIACMFWSYNGDAGWQDPTDPYGEYGHAFNLIYCQDGSDAGSELDIYYIEPQTDKVWTVIISSVPYVHYQIWLTFTGGINGTVWTEPYFINHYNYFA